MSPNLPGPFSWSRLDGSCEPVIGHL